MQDQHKELLSTLEKLCQEARSLTCECPHCRKKAIKEYKPEIPHPTVYHCHECNSNFLYLNGVNGAEFPPKSSYRGVDDLPDNLNS